MHESSHVISDTLNNNTKDSFLPCEASASSSKFLYVPPVCHVRFDISAPVLDWAADKPKSSTIHLVTRYDPQQTFLHFVRSVSSLLSKHYDTILLPVDSADIATWVESRLPPATSDNELGGVGHCCAWHVR